MRLQSNLAAPLRLNAPTRQLASRKDWRCGYSSHVVGTERSTDLLGGIRVLDLATERAELAGRTLADLGADVIKIEPPAGARARGLPPFDQGDDGDSLYWAALGLGKRSVVLDLEMPAEIAVLRRLISAADVLIESFDPGVMRLRGLDYESLRTDQPGLIYVSVTPFGQTGPAALTPATDLTLEAAGGLLGLQGDADRPPVPVGYPQAALHAGLQAAADTIIALNERDHSGQGQHLDVSMQAAMVWTLMHATGFPPNTGADPPFTGATRTWPPPDLVAGVAVPRVYRCADGYVSVAIASGRTGTWAAALRWRGEEHGIDDDIREVDWLEWDEAVAEGRLDPQLVARARDEIVALLREKTGAELMDWAVRERLLVAPIYTTADVRRDPHLEARDYWRTIGGRTHPGPAVRFSRTPMGPHHPAPALGADQRLLDDPPPPRAWSPTGNPRGAPFADVKVADFAWVGVGPLCSKALADHGANVVRVEFAGRPDGLRLAPPFKNDEPGIDHSQFFADFNSSKRGLSLNLATEAGLEIARDLIAWADVVVESFTPGTMERLGLDYATLSRDRPELIMLSTCLRGQTGTQAPYRGVGYQGSALSGLLAITGWPDRPPSGPWGAYTDFVAPRFGAAALAAAIYDRRRSGLGQHIDLSQTEAGIHFLEPLLLDYTVNGRVAAPAGHTSAVAAPHGVYQVAGVERYIALAVETDRQWQALRGVAPLEAFANEDLNQLAARQAQHEAIDAALRAWLVPQDPHEVVARLTNAGVPAALVQRPSDLYSDVQLQHREFFVTLPHAVMGPTPYDGLVTHFSAKPSQLRGPAPALGEHTEQILSHELGCSSEEIMQYAARGALG